MGRRVTLLRVLRVAGSRAPATLLSARVPSPVRTGPDDSCALVRARPAVEPWTKTLSYLAESTQCERLRWAAVPVGVSVSARYGLDIFSLDLLFLHIAGLLFPRACRQPSSRDLNRHASIDSGRDLQSFIQNMGDENIAAGTPLKAHYKKRAYTCFTPWWSRSSTRLVTSTCAATTMTTTESSGARSVRSTDFEGVPAPRVIRRSEFKCDAYDPPQPVGMDPESTAPRGCKSTG